MTEYSARVEVHPLATPKPIGISIFADGQAVAHFPVDLLREVLKRYDELEQAYSDAYSPITGYVAPDWIDCGLPYCTYDKAKSFEDSAPKPLAGILIETEYGQHLIGDINEMRGVCDDCVDFGPKTIVKRYKIIYRASDEGWKSPELVALIEKIETSEQQAARRSPACLHQESEYLLRLLRSAREYVPEHKNELRELIDFELGTGLSQNLDRPMAGSEVQTFADANGVVRVISCSYCTVLNGKHADACTAPRQR